jgi:hypothetical protein
MTDTTLRVWRHVEHDKLKAWLVDQPTVSQQEAEELRVKMLAAFDRAWLAGPVNLRDCTRAELIK